ncbi:MAG TPA: LpqB family beta-propeller domain-containing protein [Candidatus Thermoplasmatota archaeon]|nr:LpqB family beta-propeller domain-containing protein [Candidatus Thermoplasmatota archaeon]
MSLRRILAITAILGLAVQVAAWPPPSGSELEHIDSKGDPVAMAAMSADGKQIALLAGTGPYHLLVGQPATLQVVETAPLNAHSLSMSGDGSVIVASTTINQTGRLVLFDHGAVREESLDFPGLGQPSSLENVKVSRDGRTIYGVAFLDGHQGQVFKWDGTTATIVSQTSEGQLGSDLSYFASASGDGTEIVFASLAQNLGASPKGTFFLAKGSQAASKLPLPDETANYATVTPDGSTMAFALGNDPQRLWTLVGASVTEVDSPTERLEWASFDPMLSDDGQEMVFARFSRASSGGELILHDIASGQERALLTWNGAQSCPIANGESLPTLGHAAATSDLRTILVTTTLCLDGHDDSDAMDAYLLRVGSEPISASSSPSTQDSSGPGAAVVILTVAGAVAGLQRRWR